MIALVAAGAWLLLAAVASLVLGASIRLADRHAATERTAMSTAEVSS